MTEHYKILRENGYKSFLYEKQTLYVNMWKRKFAIQYQCSTCSKIKIMIINYPSDLRIGKNKYVLEKLYNYRHKHIYKTDPTFKEDYVFDSYIDDLKIFFRKEKIKTITSK